MDQIKKAVVALDLSAMDDNILHYAHLISEPLRLKQLEVIHIIPEDFIQTDRRHGMPEGTSLLKAVEGKVRSAIEINIRKYLPNTSLAINIHILEGDPYKRILKFIEDKEVDLLIAGKKNNSEGSGITAKKLARKAKYHFLFVPQIALASPKKVMVPIDFSENSAEAVYAALTLKMAIPKLQIYCPHIIRMLPADYYQELDKYKFFIDAHIAKNEKAFQLFIEEYDLPTDKLSEVLLEDHYNSIGRRLTEYLKEEKFDLVIMGAQGHKLLDRMRYGSVTERFIHYCEDTPLLVVR